MKNKYSQEMQSILDQALTEKTFNLEIVDRIKEMKDALIKLEEEMDEAKKKIALLVEENIKLVHEKSEKTVTIKSQEETINLWQKREDDLKKRELDQKIVEQARDFQTVRGNEMKEIVFAICKNPVFVQSKTRSRQEVIPAGNGMYPQTQTLTDSEEVKEEIR
jgi:regulator of replication initiation timing